MTARSGTTTLPRLNEMYVPMVGGPIHCPECGKLCAWNDLTDHRVVEHELKGDGRSNVPDKEKWIVRQRLREEL